MKESLEQQIDLRTAKLEKANQQVQERAARFQVISEISQEISANVIKAQGIAQPDHKVDQ